VKRKQHAMKHFHLSLFATIILVAILACGYQSVLRFDGYSMEPTITNGQKLFTEEISLSDLKQGDIIYFELDERLQAKRLIGLPGEKIEIRDGNIYINDQILIEDYEASSPEYRFGPITLEADRYFVLGDNRNDSNDSHQYGPINGDQIMGRVTLIQE
jgi:signal peptidase I